MVRGGRIPILLPALLLVLFRALDALSLATLFNPDEYWQGPEVAHALVFGAGLLYVLGSYCLLCCDHSYLLLC